MNKLLGFLNLTLPATEDLPETVIPLKFGAFAVDLLLEEYEIDLGNIGSIFKTVTIGKGEDAVQVIVPKKLNKFAAVLLWAGADYVSRFNGGDGYRLMDAYEWLDRIGGTNSEAIKPVYSMFWKCIKNGATPPPENPLEDSEKKSEVTESIV